MSDLANPIYTNAFLRVALGLALVFLGVSGLLDRRKLARRLPSFYARDQIPDGERWFKIVLVVSMSAFAIVAGVVILIP